jgi:hypothetical protein
MDNDIIMDSDIMASDLILMIVILIDNNWLLTTIINGQRSVECLIYALICLCVQFIPALKQTQK